MWPAAKETEQYKTFEEKVFQKLGEDDGEEWTTTQKRISHFTAVIYETAVEEFGTQEAKSLEKKKGGKSRNEKKMETIRKEKRRLMKLWKQAPPEEKEGLKALHEELKKQSRETQRRVRRMQRRKESKRNREQFIKNPYEATKKLFTEARSGSLKCTKEDLDAHVKQTYSDPKRAEPMPYIEGLKYPTEPGFDFPLGPLWEDEVDNFVRKARAKSAPGGDGVSYKVFKYCKKLRNMLFRMLRDLWEEKELVDDWCTAEGIYLPKESNAECCVWVYL